MKKLFILVLIIVLYPFLFVQSLLAIDNEVQNYIISSGSKWGNYNETGIIIADLLNKISDKLLFISVSSNGSVENISNLKQRFADFAIVQQDVLLENFYNGSNGIKNITFLFPLFEEKFIIYTQNKFPIPFYEFKNKIETWEKIKIWVTSKEGATYKTFLLITELLWADINNISFVVEDYSTLIEKFKNKEINYLLTFSLPIEELENMKKTSFVYFNNTQIFLLKNKMRRLSETNFGNVKYKTLGVMTLLIGLDSSINKIWEKQILDSLQKVVFRDEFISKEIDNTLKKFKENNNIYEDSLTKIPVSKLLLKELNYKVNCKT